MAEAEGEWGARRGADMLPLYSLWPPLEVISAVSILYVVISCNRI